MPEKSAQYEEEEGKLGDQKAAQEITTEIFSSWIDSKTKAAISLRE